MAGTAELETQKQLISPDLRARLLASIATNNLVILCGAGLSMAPPSKISSAWQVAQKCNERYRDKVGLELPKGLEDNIEAMAEYFYHSNQLEQVFLKTLIDWSEFVGRKPNKGHIAIADFLAASTCSLVLSTNLDILIEKAASELGEPDFYALVQESDLNLPKEHAPLLKIHGCAARSRHESLWCKQQLDREPLKSRLPTLVNWMQHFFPNRDLLIVGFWTDWAYLNTVFEQTVVSSEPRSIILVDPDSSEKLSAKSPALWDWARSNTNFQHVGASGDVFLDELRICVATQHISAVWQKGRDIYLDIFKKEPPQESLTSLQPLTSNELYRLRRDVSGILTTLPVRDRSASEIQGTLGAFHLALLDEGATLQSNLFCIKKQQLRLINTPSQPLSAVKRKFSNEPPDPLPPSRTVCIGALDDGNAPASIIGRGTSQNIIRNDSVGAWETHSRLLDELKNGVLA